MKICGIVAEYNPFHNGHKYHIDKTRELYGATHFVAVMSGFVFANAHHTWGHSTIVRIGCAIGWVVAFATAYLRNTTKLIDTGMWNIYLTLTYLAGLILFALMLVSPLHKRLGKAGDAVQHTLGNDVLADGDVHVESQVLLADPDELPGAPGIHEHVVTVYDNPPGRGPAHGRHGAGSGGLPGPVGAQESVYLPAPDGETDVVDSGEITEPHRESFDHDYVVWHSLTFGVFTCPWCRAGR